MLSTQGKKSQIENIRKFIDSEIYTFTSHTHTTTYSPNKNSDGTDEKLEGGAGLGNRYRTQKIEFSDLDKFSRFNCESLIKLINSRRGDIKNGDINLKKGVMGETEFEEGIEDLADLEQKYG